MSSAHTQIATVTQERGQPSFSTPLKFASKPTTYEGCFDQLHRFVGLTVCGKLSGTPPGASVAGAAAPPLNGPLRASLSLEVEHEYTLSAVHQPADDHHTVTVRFDTPGAKDARATQLVLEGGLRPKLYASARLETPAFRAQAESGLVHDADHTYAYAEYAMADKTYRAKLGVAKQAQGAGATVYTPIALVEAPGKTPEHSILGWRVSGTVTGERPAADHQRYQLNAVQLHAPAAEPVQLDGEVALLAHTFRADVRIAQGERRASVKAEVRPVRDDFKADVTLENNVAEWANGRLSVETVHKELEYRHDLLVVAGRDAANSNKRLEVHQHVHHSSVHAAEPFVRGEAHVRAPFVPLDVQLSGEYQRNAAKQQTVKFEAAATAGKQKLAGKLGGKFDAKREGDVELEGTVQLNQHQLKAEAKREVGETKTKLEGCVEVNGEAKAELEVEYEREATAQKADVKVQGSVRLAKAEEAHK